MYTGYTEYKLTLPHPTVNVCPCILVFHSVLQEVLTCYNEGHVINEHKMPHNFPLGSPTSWFYTPNWVKKEDQCVPLHTNDAVNLWTSYPFLTNRASQKKFIGDFLSTKVITQYRFLFLENTRQSGLKGDLIEVSQWPPDGGNHKMNYITSIIRMFC